MIRLQYNKIYHGWFQAPSFSLLQLIKLSQFGHVGVFICPRNVSCPWTDSPWYSASLIAADKESVSELCGPPWAKNWSFVIIRKSLAVGMLRPTRKEQPLLDFTWMLQPTPKIWKKILYFVWSPPWHLYILLLANLLAFYLTYFLAFDLAFYLAYLLAFYLAYLLADVLAYLLAYVLAYLLAYLLAYVLAYLLAFHLAFYLAYLLAYYLANLLAFHLAFYLAYLLAYYLGQICWHSIWQTFWHFIWHIFWHSSWHSIWHSIWHTFWHSIWHIF